MGHLTLGNILFMFHHTHGVFKFREFGAAASNWKLIPLGGLRSLIAQEICQLGIGFYQGGCPDPSIERAVEQIDKLLMHYGCKTIVGVLLQASSEFLILELGFSTQPFSLDYGRYEGQVTKSWLKSIWEKVAFHQRIEIGNIELVPP
jgi:hypothetical protein